MPKTEFTAEPGVTYELQFASFSDPHTWTTIEDGLEVKPGEKTIWVELKEPGLYRQRARWKE